MLSEERKLKILNYINTKHAVTATDLMEKFNASEATIRRDLTEMDKKSARGEIYLQYQVKYYTLSERRIPYQRDKTSDSRFFVVTLFAIVMELEDKTQIQSDDVIQIEHVAIYRVWFI